MSFQEFLNLFEAYRAYKDTLSQVTPAAASQVTPAAASQVTPAAASQVTPAAASQVTPAAASQVTPAAAPTMPETALPDAIVAMQTKIGMLEQQMMNPSMASVEPKGLEDVFNKILGG